MSHDATNEGDPLLADAASQQPGPSLICKGLFKKIGHFSHIYN